MAEAKDESTRRLTPPASAEASTSSSNSETTTDPPWAGARTIAIPWRKLSPEERETLQTITLPISLGRSRKEVARKLGLTEFVVASRYRTLQQRLWELSQDDPA